MRTAQKLRSAKAHMASFFTEISSNKLKSNLIIIFFFLFVLGIGSFLGYFWLQDVTGAWTGIILALIIGGIYFLIAWFAGSNIILSTTGAKPVTKKEYP